MDLNFVQADNSNLPKVDALMVAFFFKNNADYYVAELKHVKTTMSGRESYGDDAIGYVQLHREHGLCTLKCKMCPEHKVRSKAYNVTMVINENESEIISCQCHDCAASAGGCKHAVAFLMWVHRRSEEPPSTSVECYWKKPTLSRVGTTLKYITVQQMSKKEVPHRPSTSALYTDFVLEAKKRKLQHCELIKYQDDFKHSNVMRYSLHCFIMDQPPKIQADVDNLVDIMKTTFNRAAISAIEEATRMQYKSSLWYEMRYGRITASKAHEVSVCHTPDGSLVATIMGAKIPDTIAMKREIMPRNYIRKTTRQNWDEQAMIKAIEAVKQGMPYKAASKQFLVPLMALKRRVKGKNVYAVGGTKMLGSIKKVFTDEQELELVQHIKDNEETMYGFTVDDVRKFAFEIAERNKIRHPFSTTSRKAGKD
ncbi:unnamed protein product [Acanthoscelides obtectus]|uniref:SWIM-type domain-containing protein n=1 Tax=Acanthoscelides obtectus TaxID=200917 RepID=A0A9P0JVY8_ACAOB|nr:unnamed protein product [Acanthoscelides obtectus]CAK1625278.1 hypothetical protein AOBTE_LOCUS3081 [Acanthoscelides obtectus]